MARDFPNGSASKPNLSCCCVARHSFFFLCGGVNWPLWLPHSGFLPLWVWDVCSKWICGWKEMPLVFTVDTLDRKKRPFSAMSSLIRPGCNVSRVRPLTSPTAVDRNADVNAVDVRVPVWQRWECWFGITLGEDLSWCLSLKRRGQLGTRSHISDTGRGESSVAFGHDNWPTDPADLGS